MVFCKVWWSQILRLTCPAMAIPVILKVGYLRNYCSYLLNICIDESMKTSLSETEIKFKNIQKMREKLKVTTNYLTVPRISVTWCCVTDFDFWTLQVLMYIGNYLKMGTVSFYYTVIGLKDSDWMANSVDPDLICDYTICPDLSVWKLRINTV